MKHLSLKMIAIALAWGSLLTAGERVMVGDDIYVGPDEVIGDTVCIGCSIHIEGRVAQAVAIGGSVYLDGGEISGDTVAVGGSLVLNGQVDGDAVAVGGSVDLDGTVNGDVVGVFGGVKMRDESEIAGDVVAVLSGVERLGSASIAGAVTETKNWRSLAISAAVIGLILVLVFGLAVWPFVSFVCFAIMGSERAGVLAQTVSERTGMAFLLGIGVFVGMMFSSMFLPLALFFLPGSETIFSLAFLVVAAVGYTGVGLWVGRGLVKTGSGMGATVFGSVLITFVQLIPVIGWFIAWPIFAMLALGAAVLSGFGTSVDWLLPRTGADPIARPTPG